MSDAPLRELSLFSGGGGGLLGSHLLGWQIMGMAEWTNSARAILEARIADGSLPDVTIHRDVQELDPTEYIGKVDIVTGGFPCQPFSTAGKRLGVDDPRNMWPHTIRILKGTQAPYGFFENVGALLSSGYFGTVLGDLTAAGFDVAWDDVPASAVGAPHLRSRLWIYARKRTGDEPDTREIPLKRIATMGSEGWERLTGHGSWSDETDHGEPAKWPRSGVVLGDVAYHTPRAAFPKGIPKRYGVWPHVRLSWAKKAPLEAESRFQKMWTTPMAGEARTYTLPPSAVVRGSLTGDMVREYGPHGQGYFEGGDAPAEHDRMWNTPKVHDSKVASLPAAELTRDSLAGDMAREHGVNGRTFVGHEEGMWPTPTATDGQRRGKATDPDHWIESAHRHAEKGVRLHLHLNVAAEFAEQDRDPRAEMWPTPTTMDASGRPVRSPEELAEARAAQGGGMRNLREAVPHAQAEMFPTPVASRNDKSRKAMTFQQSPPGLGQHLNLLEGRIPVELEGVRWDELPPRTHEILEQGGFDRDSWDAHWETFPTPTATERAGINPNTGKGAGLSRTVKDRAAKDRHLYPTPRAGKMTGETQEAWEARRARGDVSTPPMALAAAMADESDYDGIRYPTILCGGSMAGGPGAQAQCQDLIDQGIPEKEAVRMFGFTLEGMAKWRARGGKADPNAKRTAYKDADKKQEAQEADNTPAVETPAVEKLFFPTPTAFEGDSISDTTEVPSNYKRPLYDKVAGRTWPTPVASDAKGANLSFSDTMSANNLPTTAIRAEAAKTGTDASYKMGLLNPEWVAWLMGWPIGWTSPEPLPEGNLETWMEMSRGRSWWRSEPEGIPRLTHKGTEAGSRANRLKALGNGQVSLCCARSYEVLRQTLDLCYTQAEQDEEPVGLDALFGF